MEQNRKKDQHDLIVDYRVASTQEEEKRAVEALAKTGSFLFSRK